MIGKALAGALLVVGVLSVLGIGPNLFARRLPGAGEFRYHAEWKAYLAPDGACADGEATDASVDEQEATMLCLLNWARTKRGLTPLRSESTLMRAADLKAADMVRCQDFSHHACGAAPDARARESGHKGNFGENISWGTGPARSPKATLDGWLNSDGHRRNLFQPIWTSQGVGL